MELEQQQTQPGPLMETFGKIILKNNIWANFTYCNNLNRNRTTWTEIDSRKTKWINKLNNQNPLDFPITKEEPANNIIKLNSGKACGVDTIRTEMMNTAALSWDRPCLRRSVSFFNQAAFLRSGASGLSPQHTRVEINLTLTATEASVWAVIWGRCFAAFSMPGS